MAGNRRFAWVLAALAAAGLAGGCSGASESSRVAAVPLQVQTVPVTEESVSGGLEIDGTVVGRLEAVVSSRLSAPVAEVPAVPGRSVKAGEVLVRLVPAEAQSALEGARAALSAARSVAELATQHRKRYEGLESRGVAAPAELDVVRREEASAMALVAAAQASLRRAEADLSQVVLTAPFDAIVVEKLVSPGDLTAPGRPLVRISSRVGQRVEAAPGEADAAKLHVGDPVEVLLGTQRVEGRVAEIAGGVDPVTRRRNVRVDLPAGLEPPVGSFARLRLPGARESQIAVPRSAVVHRGGLEIAWIVGFDQRVSLRYVRTGPELAGGLVQIRSGLEVGERIVVDPPATLAAGARVSS